MRTKPVSAAQVPAYARKAEEYAAAAASELDAGRFVAATSLAINAAINAADAVCGARFGQRAAGESHDQVLVLLRQAGKDGAEIDSDLLRLLRLKTKASTNPTTSPLRRPPRPSSGRNAASSYPAAPPTPSPEPRGSGHVRRAIDHAHVTKDAGSGLAGA